ncbi:bifunctional diguanylate cyclase/phosphodiesterase [Kineosporia sp. NBRC 101731]|uniref:bifunctional diguanylate cyclase/phosphodiesterase n=1 Tax=Kineosporia sp. NBRC 101731 TaxID=3032199 RepID=UPI002557A803|nr:bifunctional diguanylate cyclase/phosphodiesterase [Kineosporia sp. NBRC 101731]
MTRFGLPVTGIVTIVGMALAGLTVISLTGLLDDFADHTLDDVNRVLAGGLATGCLLHTWRPAARGPAGDRNWRLLLAGGTGIWTTTQLIGHHVGSPALADAGRLVLPVLALPALALPALGLPALVLPALRTAPSRRSTLRRSSHRPSPHRHRPAEKAGRPFAQVVFALDTIVVIGSLFLLFWVTSLRSAVREGALQLTASLADLALVVLVLLIALFRTPDRARSRDHAPDHTPAPALLGFGLVAVAVADSHAGRPATPVAQTLIDLTVLAGLVLVAGGALTDTRPRHPGNPPGTTPSKTPSTTPGTAPLDRLFHRLPYLPLTLASFLVAGQLLTRSTLDPVETALATALVVAVVLRQLSTGLDNVRLVAELRESQDRLRAQAFHDSLTGLPNRALFDQRLRHAIRGGRPLGLLFCDLDDFKAVNDRLGHTVGDDLLRAVGDRLRDCVGPGDTVARLGGDEFAVLMEDATEGPDVIGRRILASVGKPFQLTHHGQEARVRVGASVGVAVLDRVAPDASPESLLAGVDQAMYAAKRRGKNQLVTFRTGSGDRTGQDRYLPLFDPAAPPEQTVPEQQRAQDAAPPPPVGSPAPPPGLPRVMDPQTGPIPRPGSRPVTGGLTTPAAVYRASGQARPEPPRPVPSPEDAKEAEKEKLVAATQRDTERWMAEYEESERRASERNAAQMRAFEALQIEAEVRAGTRPEAEIIPFSRATELKQKARPSAGAIASSSVDAVDPDDPDGPTDDTLERAEQLATLSLDHIDVLYRPVIDLKTGKLQALSSTVRWRHPVHGLMTPDSLMAAAEHAGLRRALEERLFDAICHDIALLRKAPAWDTLTAHVPLNASYITDERLAIVVERTLRRHELPGRALVLHLTETRPVNDLPAAAGILGRITDLGVGIGLDAFGSGPSGLGLLTHLPIGSIVLDESLTTADPQSRAARVLAGTIAMTPGLDLLLIADGVDHQEQADRLGGLGVHQGQGPLYGQPVPLPELDLRRLPTTPA